MPYSNERRREIYQQMRELGLTSKQATSLRSRSEPRITNELLVIDREIRTTPIRERPVEQRQVQQNIASYLADQIETFSDDIFENHPNLREVEWSLWSRDGGEFPSEHLERIIEINTDAGKPELAQYGFIQYYYEYVEGRSEEYAQEQAEQGSP